MQKDEKGWEDFKKLGKKCKSVQRFTKVGKSRQHYEKLYKSMP